MAIPKLKYLLQCDEVRDDNGKFSAIGIFDRIWSFVYPARHKQFGLLLGFYGAQGSYELELQVSAPDGSDLGRINGKLELRADDNVANVAINFQDLPLPAEGEYTISLFLNGDFYTEHKFFVQAPFQQHDRTPEQIQMLLANPDIVKVANADVQCERCKAMYRFQLYLDSTVRPEPGFLALPPGDSFNCGSCGQQVNIAQIRRNLQNIVGIPRQWLEAAFNPAPQKPEPQQGQ